MIDLNKVEYTTNRFDWKATLQTLDLERVYSYYLNEDISRCRKISSPFREDSRASFSIFNHRDDQSVLMWKDHASGETGDIIRLVQLLYGFPKPSYAVFKIVSDFDVKLVINDTELSDVQLVDKIKNRVKVPKKKADIKVIYREWTLLDKKFWNGKYGLSTQTLNLFNVKPISHLFLNNNIIALQNIGYAYLENKDDYNSYKIYQPFQSTMKWVTNHDGEVHQGYRQLPKKADLLIITKSLKDVMCLYQHANIASIAPQSETVRIKESVFEEYKKRFKKIIILYDNDKQGIKSSKQQSFLNNLPYILLPSFPGVKDYSDCIEKFGVKKANLILFEQLNNLQYGSEDDVK